MHGVLLDNVTFNMFESCNSGIDFLPSQMMKEDKTTGCLTTYCMKVIKVWLWLFRDYGLIVESKHDNTSVEPTNQAAKMCSTFLKSHNEIIIESIAEKDEPVRKYNKSMIMNSKNVRKVKVERII